LLPIESLKKGEKKENFAPEIPKKNPKKKKKKRLPLSQKKKKGGDSVLQIVKGGKELRPEEEEL